MSVPAAHKHDLAIRRKFTEYFEQDPRLMPADIHAIAMRSMPETRPQELFTRLAVGSMCLEAAFGSPSPSLRDGLLRRSILDVHPLPKFNPGNARTLGFRTRARRIISAAHLGFLQFHKQDLAPYAAELRDQMQELLPPTDTAEQRAKVITPIFKGVLMEQNLINLLHNPDAGTLATPSFYRQDYHHAVGGLKYSWDVTVESNGETIPRGQYRVQAKYAMTDSDVAAYHPDIVLVSGRHHLGRMTPIGVGRAIAEGQPLIGLRVDLLSMLSEQGPATTETMFFTNAA